MKELITKILREESQKKFSKAGPNKERFIIQHMEKLLSKTNRVVVPPDENYGNYNEEWCRGGKVIIEAKYFFNSEDNDDNIFFAGDLYVNNEEIDLLSRLLQLRKSYILNVITEWYDDKYATKFGQETGHPEFEIDETHESDVERKCYQIIDTSNLSREYMIDYIDTQSLHKVSELEKMNDDLLELTYKRVYNIHSNK